MTDDKKVDVLTSHNTFSSWCGERLSSPRVCGEDVHDPCWLYETGEKLYVIALVNKVLIYQIFYSGRGGSSALEKQI